MANNLVIDTAPGYKNHPQFAQFLHDDLANQGLRREDLFISTKLSPANQGTEKCEEAINDALTTLGVDYLDLYLIHWPGTSGKKPEDSCHPEMRKQSWRKMEEFCKAGVLKSIGVSNYTARHLQELLAYCEVKPSVNQVEFHPHLFQRELLEFCQQNDIVLQAYSSLGAAEGVSSLLAEPVLQQIATNHGKTVPQVLLRWALQHGVAVIPKSSKPERIRENINLWDFKLSSEEMERIDGLNKDKHYCWDPTLIT